MREHFLIHCTLGEQERPLEQKTFTPLFLEPFFMLWLLRPDFPSYFLSNFSFLCLIFWFMQFFIGQIFCWSNFLFFRLLWYNFQAALTAADMGSLVLLTILLFTMYLWKLHNIHMIHWWHYLIATSLFYYINGHCSKFATKHKSMSPSMPT